MQTVVHMIHNDITLGQTRSRRKLSSSKTTCDKTPFPSDGCSESDRSADVFRPSSLHDFSEFSFFSFFSPPRDFTRDAHRVTALVRVYRTTTSRRTRRSNIVRAPGTYTRYEIKSIPETTRGYTRIPFWCPLVLSSSPRPSTNVVSQKSIGPQNVQRFRSGTSSSRVGPVYYMIFTHTKNDRRTGYRPRPGRRRSRCRRSTLRHYKIIV